MSSAASPPPALVQSAATPFDYQGLDKVTAEAARGAVERYRTRVKAYVLDTGKDLLAVKERLDHGLFQRWVEAEMALTPRTAQNFMQAAAQLGHKSETVSHLPPTTLYRLAAPSTPDETRERVLELAEQGRVEPKAVDQIVAEGRAAAREAARKASLSPEAQAADAKKAKARAAAKAKSVAAYEKGRAERYDAERRAAKAGEDAARWLADRLGDSLPNFQSMIQGANHGRFREVLAELSNQCGSHPAGT